MLYLAYILQELLKINPSKKMLQLLIVATKLPTFPSEFAPGRMPPASHGENPYGEISYLSFMTALQNEKCYSLHLLPQKANLVEFFNNVMSSIVLYNMYIWGNPGLVPKT